MEQYETAKPQSGTWDNLEKMQATERKPKVEFTMNSKVTVTFAEDFQAPTEMPGKDGGVYYIFDCIHVGEQKIFMTSAWSLLRGLKQLEPLAGKSVIIAKQMIEGKQNYEVSLQA